MCSRSLLSIFWDKSAPLQQLLLETETLTKLDSYFKKKLQLSWTFEHHCNFVWSIRIKITKLCLTVFMSELTTDTPLVHGLASSVEPWCLGCEHLELMGNGVSRTEPGSPQFGSLLGNLTESQWNKIPSRRQQTCLLCRSCVSAFYFIFVKNIGMLWHDKMQCNRDSSRKAHKVWFCNVSYSTISLKLVNTSKH